MHFLLSNSYTKWEKIMPTITKSLIYSEVKFGLLIVRELRSFFPKSKEKVTIIDEDGEEFVSHMHSVYHSNGTHTWSSSGFSVSP